MKNEDFKELQEFCDKKGYQLVNESLEDNAKFFVVSKKKDIWEGVEFAECVKGFGIDDDCFTIGRIYKVNPKGSGVNFKFFLLDNNYDPNGFRAFNKEFFKPSSEQAYVTQLKKEASERFGDIKEGDRFIEPDGKFWELSNVFKDSGNPQWDYLKIDDTLCYYCLVIYSKGKWAERVNERVKVYIESYEAESKKPNPEWNPNATFRFISRQEIKLDGNVGQFLAKQLEKYLNKEL